GVQDYMQWVYQKASQRTPTGKSWSGIGDDSIEVLDAAAADFGITAVKTGTTFNKPTQQDQMKLAALWSRFVSMWTDINQPVKFALGASGSSATWANGSPSVLTLPPSYFGLSGDALGTAVVTAIVASRSDISPGLRASYVDFVTRVVAVTRKFRTP